MIKYGSVCSGIESASVAWEPLGMKPTWFSEIEKFPSAVLAHHWPDVVNLGDMTLIKGMLELGIVTAPDILVGGTPCQAFSIAGMRKGLEDERGQLTIEYVRLLNVLDNQRRKQGKQEAVCVWENVPGVLSSKDNAFGCFLSALVGEDDPLEPAGKKWSNAGVVYGPERVAAWRILDAQYFGVAQRRRRVFVVASARNGFNPAAVLFESESLRRDTPPSREAEQETAGHAEEGSYSTSGAGYWRDGIGALRGRTQDSHENIVACLDANYGKLQGCSGQDLNHGHSHLVVHGSQDPCVSDKAFALGRNGGRENVPAIRTANTSANGIGIDEELAYTLDGAQGQAVAAFSAGQSKGAGSIAYKEEQTPTLRGGASGTNQVPTLHAGTTVRRLTPVECERLQGFPDNHTHIPWKLYKECQRKKISYERELITRGLRLNGCTTEECPDGPRYKAIGNSKAVPVIRWVGERLLKELNKVSFL